MAHKKTEISTTRTKKDKVVVAAVSAVAAVAAVYPELVQTQSSKRRSKQQLLHTINRSSSPKLSNKKRLRKETAVVIVHRVDSDTTTKRTPSITSRILNTLSSLLFSEEDLRTAKQVGCAFEAFTSSTASRAKQIEAQTLRCYVNSVMPPPVTTTTTTAPQPANATPIIATKSKVLQDSTDNSSTSSSSSSSVLII